MRDTPRGNQLHIAIFGRRNAGKSSLINALTRQDIALVSNVPGTTTDPVFKSMEILPLGPCVIIDTAGLDDTGSLGALRVKKTREVLNQTDLALLVIDAAQGVSAFERDILEVISSRRLPVVGVLNKIDLEDGLRGEMELELGLPLVPVSARRGTGMEDLILEIIKKAPGDLEPDFIVRDLLPPGGVCVLVVPIDGSAPRGRLILPQVQTLRDLLDGGCVSLVTRDSELPAALEKLGAPPDLVVTDSQAFKVVAETLPPDVPLTSFSILFARFKGDLAELTAGARAMETLRPGDRVLIAEACSHHRQKDDIGQVKIPRLLEKKVGGELRFTWSSGMGYPEDLEDFKLVVHCGGCMINRRQMWYRIDRARRAGVPVVNYGVLLASLNGILERAIKPLPGSGACVRDEHLSDHLKNNCHF